jgi:hypothetical protein
VVLPALGMIGKLIVGEPALAGAETIAEAKKAGLSEGQAKAYVANTNKAIMAAYQQSAGQLQNLGGAIMAGSARHDSCPEARRKSQEAHKEYQASRRR